LAKLKDKMGGSLPSDFITWLEVIMGGEKGLLACDYNDYNYYNYFNDAMRKNGLSNSDISKVKIWSSDFPKEHPICGSWILPTERFVIQYDDHDQQNQGSSSRDMQDTGSVLVKDRDVAKHRNFNMRLFSRTDGNWKIRNVLSSWYWGQAGRGFPADGFSDCSRYKGSEVCKNTPYRPAFVPDACGYTAFLGGKPIEGEYTRTHRDVGVINSMRRWMGLAPIGNKELGLPGNCQ
jgi:alpha-amylase